VKDNPSLFYHQIGEIYHRSSEIGRGKPDDGAESAGNPSGDGMTYKKKLIEVALPLDAINKASAREKSIHNGHPSTQLIPPNCKPGGQIHRQSIDNPSTKPNNLSTGRRPMPRNNQTILRLYARIFRSGLGRSLLKSSDNLPMFCRNLPILSPAEAVLNHPAFIRCAGTIIRNTLELS